MEPEETLPRHQDQGVGVFEPRGWLASLSPSFIPKRGWSPQVREGLVYVRTWVLGPGNSSILEWKV